MEQNQATPLFQLNLDANNSYTLRNAASWAKVLGVAGIIIGILLVAMGVMIQSVMDQSIIGKSYDEEMGYSSKMVANMGLAVYVVMGLVFLISSIFALSFGNKISRALRTNDQIALGAGFASARNYFAFWAILMIIGLLLMLITVAGLATAGS